MWSNFFGRGEEGRGGLGSGMRPPRRGGEPMSEGKEGTVKLTLFLALSGVTLMVLALGTDYWAELSGMAVPGNVTCTATYFGVWRQCRKTIETWEVEEGRQTCGPVELPGVATCSYFKFYTTGESTKIMGRTVEKDLFIVIAVLTLLSLCLMILGSLSILMALNRQPDLLMKLSSACFIVAGMLAIAGLVTFEEACASILRQDGDDAEEGEGVGGAGGGEDAAEFAHLWSFACASAAGVIALVAGGAFLLVASPGVSRRVCGCCRSKAPGP